MTHNLSGKRAICQFVGRGWTTVEGWILNMGFPAKMILGIWESDSELITAWRQEQLLKKQKATQKLRGNPNFNKKSPKSTKIL